MPLWISVTLFLLSVGGLVALELHRMDCKHCRKKDGDDTDERG